MRLILLVVVAWSSVAAAEPSWSDTEAMIESATAPVDPALIACRKTTTPPWRIALIVTRNAKTGDANVNMPFPNVGIRGFTDEERCLMKTVAQTSVRVERRAEDARRGRRSCVARSVLEQGAYGAH